MPDYTPPPRPISPIFDLSRPPTDLGSFLSQGFASLTRYFESMHTDKVRANALSRRKDIADLRAANVTWFDEAARRPLPSEGTPDIQEQFSAFFDSTVNKIRSSTMEENRPDVDFALAGLQRESALQMAQFRAQHLDQSALLFLREDRNMRTTAVASAPQQFSRILREGIIAIQDSPLPTIDKQKLESELAAELHNTRIVAQARDTAAGVRPASAQLDVDGAGRYTTPNVRYKDNSVPSLPPAFVEALGAAVTNAGLDLSVRILDGSGRFAVRDAFGKPLEALRRREVRADIYEYLGERGQPVTDKPVRTSLEAYAYGRTRHERGGFADPRASRYLSSAQIADATAAGTRLGVAQREAMLERAAQDLVGIGVAVCGGAAACAAEINQEGPDGIMDAALRGLPLSGAAALVQTAVEAGLSTNKLRGLIERLPKGDRKDALTMLLSTRAADREAAMKAVESAGKGGLLPQVTAQQVMRLMALSNDGKFREFVSKQLDTHILRQNRLRKQGQDVAQTAVRRALGDLPGGTRVESVGSVLEAVPLPIREIVARDHAAMEAVEKMVTAHNENAGFALATDTRALNYVVGLSRQQVAEQREQILNMQHLFARSDWVERVLPRLKVAADFEMVTQTDYNNLRQEVGRRLRGMGYREDELARLTTNALGEAAIRFGQMREADPDKSRPEQTYNAAAAAAFKIGNEGVADFEDIPPRTREGIRARLMHVEGIKRPRDWQVEAGYAAEVNEDFAAWAELMPRSVAAIREAARALMLKRGLEVDDPLMLENVTEALWRKDTTALGLLLRPPSAEGAQAPGAPGAEAPAPVSPRRYTGRPEGLSPNVEVRHPSMAETLFPSTPLPGTDIGDGSEGGPSLPDALYADAQAAPDVPSALDVAVDTVAAAATHVWQVERENFDRALSPMADRPEVKALREAVAVAFDSASSAVGEAYSKLAAGATLSPRMAGELVAIYRDKLIGPVRAALVETGGTSREVFTAANTAVEAAVSRFSAEVLRLATDDEAARAAGERTGAMLAEGTMDAGRAVVATLASIQGTLAARAKYVEGLFGADPTTAGEAGQIILEKLRDTFIDQPIEAVSPEALVAGVRQVVADVKEGAVVGADMAVKLARVYADLLVNPTLEAKQAMDTQIEQVLDAADARLQQSREAINQQRAGELEAYRLRTRYRPIVGMSNAALAATDTRTLLEGVGFQVKAGKNAPSLVRQSVEIKRALPTIHAVLSRHPVQLVITGGDGPNHSEGSKHPLGDALDIRGHGIDREQGIAIASELQAALDVLALRGGRWDVVFHTEYADRQRWHFHIEFDRAKVPRKPY